MQEEVWLRGPLEGVDRRLMPVAHALLQAREDLERELSDLNVLELWFKPGNAASLGFHVQHIAGSIERLLTYAMGGSLNEAQRRAIPLEAEPGDPPADAASVLRSAQNAIDTALKTMHFQRSDDLYADRFVGRAKLPSTMLGILFHIAEHTSRHVGQIITTKKIIRTLKLVEQPDSAPRQEF